MAEEQKKKRQLKKTETVRQRVERGTNTAPKQRRVSKTAKVVSRPFRAAWRAIKFVLRPFSFVLVPFKTRPARFVGRILASVLLLRFIRESWTELRQVQWPKARETARLTTAVFIFSIVFGSIIAVTDYGLDKVFRALFID